jgi:hypothetical protein
METAMANVQYFDAAWITSLQGGGTPMGFVLSGVPFGTSVGLLCWPVGQNGPVLQVQNMRAADNVFFEVANVGSSDSVADGINFAFSLVSQ